MQRFAFVGLLVIGGCFGSKEATTPGPTETEHVGWSGTGGAAPGGKRLVFTEGSVHSMRKCDENAPLLLVIEAQTGSRPAFSVAVELRHGPMDPVPRPIAVGGSSSSRCEPGCTGTVWLESVAPGKRVLGRLDLKWEDGRVARDRFDYEWRGGMWDVSSCHGSHDAHP